MLTDSWSAPFFADAEISQLFSAEQFASYFLAFEKALLRAQIDTKIIDANQGERALALMSGFVPHMEGLEAGMARDGVPVPAFVTQLKKHCGSMGEVVHLGTTSQDLVDTAYALAFSKCISVFQSRMSRLAEGLEKLVQSFGRVQIMGQTRMQAALPIPVAHRINGWLDPLANHRSQLGRLLPLTCRLQLAGPVGTGVSDDPDLDACLRRSMAAELQLEVHEGSWQTDRTSFVAFGSALSTLAGTLGKMGVDVSLMAQQGVDNLVLRGGGSSSVMAHKNNPVLAEKLVAVSRYCSGIVGVLHTCQVHEQERSGVAWTLEWMLLAQLCELSGRALLDGNELVGQIERMGPR